MPYWKCSHVGADQKQSASAACPLSDVNHGLGVLLYLAGDFKGRARPQLLCWGAREIGFHSEYREVGGAELFWPLD